MFVSCFSLAGWKKEMGSGDTKPSGGLEDKSCSLHFVILWPFPCDNPAPFPALSC